MENIKKKKKSGIGSRKKIAQTHFNRYIRSRDQLSGGTWICISCGKEIIKPLASHYFSVKSYSHMRYDEMNVHTACYYCNTHLHGNLLEYRRMLIIKYGEEYVNELELKGFNKPKHRTAKFEREYVEKIIKKYNAKV